MSAFFYFAHHHHQHPPLFCFCFIEQQIRLVEKLVVDSIWFCICIVFFHPPSRTKYVWSISYHGHHFLGTFHAYSQVVDTKCNKISVSDSQSSSWSREKKGKWDFHLISLLRLGFTLITERSSSSRSPRAFLFFAGVPKIEHEWTRLAFTYFFLQNCMMLWFWCDIIAE